MKPNQLAQLMAAPLASLFLVLTLCAFALGSNKSAGFRLPLLRVHQPQPGLWRDCGDSRVIFVSLLGTGELQINQDTITWDQLAPRIGHIMKFRAQPSIYVLADPEVSYQQFATLIDRITGSTSNIQIGLVSAGLLSSLKSQYRGPCSLDWPAYTFRPSTSAAPTTHF